MRTLSSGSICFRKIRFYVLAITFSLFLAFSFAPNSSAYTLFKEYPSSSDMASFYTEVYGGCAFDVYNIGSSSSPLNVLLGSQGYPSTGGTDSASPLYNCGYRFVNNKFNYGAHSWGLTRTLTIGTDGVASTDSYASTGGNTNSIFSYNSDFNNYNFDIYNQIEMMRITTGAYNSSRISLPVATASMCTDENDVLQTSGCYEQAFYLYVFDIPESASNVGTSGYLYSGSLSYSSGWPMDTGATYSEIKDSSITFCGVSNPTGTDEFLSSILPNLWNNIPSGYSRCLFAGFIPLSTDGYVILGNGNRQIDFVSADPTFYSSTGWVTSSGLNLSNYGYPWRGLFRSPSYKAMGARNDQSFKFINPHFYIFTPDDFSDVVSMSKAYTSFNALRGEAVSGSNSLEGDDSSDTPSNNLIMTWFGGFTDIMSVAFPFSSFFSGFINHDTCTNIPIIASWLNLPSNTQYCSWWPSNVTSTLTPVFTGLSMMLLFGFIVSWLRGDNASSVFGNDAYDTNWRRNT